MHFVSFSQLGSAAASLQISLVTPEKRMRTDIGCRHRSGSGLSDIRSQILLLNADIGNLSRKMYIHAPIDPYRICECDTGTQYPATLSDEKFWSTPSDERDAIYQAIAIVFWDLIATAEMSGFNFRSCILKKMDLNRKKYRAQLCKVRSALF